MDNKLDLNTKVKKDFLNYANAVIKSRAISNVEDNLKPVHRRILYAMNELDLASNKKHKKSARIVGDIIGKYHPHGDLSAYEAMIRLSQPWKMRYPLVEVQGNSGNILGDGPAAMRYTEARLTVFGDMMMEGIDKGGSSFKPNYDESTKEPVLMPSLFPNILCNGNAGIAIGLSASLVPHNLKEVVNGIVAYLNFKGITVEKLMKHIPGPDFPTGGTIVNSGDIRNIYESGSGTLTLRSKYVIENVGNQQHIVITEVPFLVNVEDGVIEPLKKLVIEEGFDLIEDFENNTGKEGVNLRIILKKGANVYKVLETLWQNTRLQITQRISNTLIVKGNPKVLSLKEMIENYVEHRHEVISNIAKFDLEKTQNRIMVVSALLKALASIDKVIELIKNAKDKSDARTRLIKFLEINEFQANAILDMRLSRINQLDGMELKNELSDLQKKEKELLNRIESPAVREELMKIELLTLSTKYGDPRRTVLTHQGSEDESMPIQDLKILMLANGGVFATQQKLENLDLKRKTSTLNAAAITVTVDTKTDKDLVVFTKDGSMSHLKVLTIATENLEFGHFSSTPLAAFDFNDKDNLKDYIVFVTSAGLVKKTPTSEYLKAKNGSRTIKLKGDQELIFVGMANDTDNIMILDEKLTYFKVSDIVSSSKLTIGSKGISSGNAKAAAIISDNEKVLMLNNKGQGKLTEASDFTYAAKGSNGQVVADDTVLVTKQSNVYFIFDGSKNNLVTSQPSIKSKTATGAKVISGSPVGVSV